MLCSLGRGGEECLWSGKWRKPFLLPRTATKPLTLRRFAGLQLDTARSSSFLPSPFSFDGHDACDWFLDVPELLRVPAV